MFEMYDTIVSLPIRYTVCSYCMLLLQTFSQKLSLNFAANKYMSSSLLGFKSIWQCCLRFTRPLKY